MRAKFVTSLVLFATLFGPTGAVAEESNPVDDVAGLQQAVTKGATPQVIVCDDGVKRLDAPGAASNNFKLHPCPSGPKPAPLPDLFAATCSCPTPEKSLKAFRDAPAPHKKKLQTEMKSAVGALAAAPAVASEFDKRVKAACAACDDKLNKDFGDLSSCLWSKASDGMAMSEDQALLHIDSRLVYRAATKTAGWAPKEAENPGAFRFNDDFIKIDPPLTQDQCTKLDIYSKRGFSSELLRDLSIRVLKKPYDFSAVPKGFTRREVAEDIYSATAKAHNDLMEAMQPKASLAGPQKDLLDPILKQAQEWMEKQIRAKAPTSEMCDKLPQDQVIRCGSETIGVEVAVNRMRNRLSNIKLAPTDSISGMSGLAGSYGLKDKTIRISPAIVALAKTNPTAVAHVLAHEVGHAVMDLIQNTFNIPESKTGLFQCLRSNASVAATTSPDQLDDAFADWFSTELVAEKLGDKTSAARSYLDKDKVLCDGGYTERTSDAKEDDHPSSPDRMNRITAAHPKIRKALGGKELPEAKDGSSTASLAYCAPPGGLDIDFWRWAKESRNDP